MHIKKVVSFLIILILICNILCSNSATISAATTADSVSTSNTSSTASVESTVSANTNIKLEITSSKTKTINTTKSTYTFTGTSDPEKAVTINGKKITRKKDGSFSKKVSLKVGKNTFTFVHKKQKLTYTVNYEYILVKSYSPSESQTFDCGKTITVSVRARKGSKVTATFRKKKITLTANSDATTTFVKYSGKFTLPKNYSVDINCGKIKFNVSNKVKSESFTSGNIICKRNTSKKVTYSSKDPDYNLSGGRYLDVGKGKIAEVVCYEAETFNAKSTNDWSRPTNNYLPKGTVDYCSDEYAYYKGSTVTKKYAVLRCGLQVYMKRQNSPSTEQNIRVTKVYDGVLPDHNEIGVVSLKNGTTHTTLTLDTMWKAPFYLKLPQQYSNPSKQDYRISEATYKYVDITFCYSTVFSGEITIPKDNPLFKSAKIIKNKSDYKLRLYLKKTGGFYGWTADFNSKGQLVFKFLNPAEIKTAKNKYGYDLTGVRILIDVGHGGKDPGAVSFSKTHTEAYQNLYLAKKVKKELESIGATVYMTRTTDVTSTSDDKLKMLKKLKPDYCIAIHHNSSLSSSPNGFDCYYSQPFSMMAAKLIRLETSNTTVYKSTGLNWHYYYTARSSVCPVVLTENGFMSNKYDYNKIIKSSVNLTKAKTITKGIVKYFKSIQ